jgi:hypothetical protein
MYNVLFAIYDIIEVQGMGYEVWGRIMHPSWKELDLEKHFRDLE